MFVGSHGIEWPHQRVKWLKLVATRNCLHVSVTIWFKNRLHDFLAFLFINRALYFSLGSHAPCWSTITLHFFMVMPWFFRWRVNLILMFTCAPQSYLTFEEINVSSQQPCILHACFTQAYRTLDTLSSTIMNS